MKQKKTTALERKKTQIQKKHVGLRLLANDARHVHVIFHASRNGSAIHATQFATDKSQTRKSHDGYASTSRRRHDANGGRDRS
jgi:hypothetical protein